jgi:hypothetical protein
MVTELCHPARGGSRSTDRWFLQGISLADLLADEATVEDMLAGHDAATR